MIDVFDHMTPQVTAAKMSLGVTRNIWCQNRVASQKRLETTDVNDKVHKSQLWSGNKRKRPRATNIRNNQPPCSFRQNNKNVDFFLLGREKQKSYWAPGGKRHTYMSLLKRYMGLYCLFMFFLLSPGTKSKHFLLYTRWFYWCYLCRCFF